MLLSSCAKEIKYIGHDNLANVNKSNLKPEQYVSDSKRQLCFLFLCTRYSQMKLNDFIYDMIEEANKKGISGSYMTDIKVEKINFDVFFGHYIQMSVTGAVINK